MDEPPKKRRFWQLHLSTLILITITVSMLAYFQLHPTLTGPSMPLRGWPRPVYRVDYATWGDGQSFPYEGITLDLVCCLSLIANVALISEIMIRRRERKHD
jgi:hypothetical protein